MRIADYDIHTPGHRPDVLVAMNPAALKKSIGKRGRTYRQSQTAYVIVGPRSDVKTTHDGQTRSIRFLPLANSLMN